MFHVKKYTTNNHVIKLCMREVGMIRPSTRPLAQLAKLPP
nr:MAG TPA: hypothetical protein [Caudoviricetes sp.]DAW76575.1 MAG TPA: hypothetical protein [Caudoviricetes sp.]